MKKIFQNVSFLKKNRTTILTFRYVCSCSKNRDFSDYYLIKSSKYLLVTCLHSPVCGDHKFKYLAYAHRLKLEFLGYSFYVLYIIYFP